MAASCVVSNLKFGHQALRLRHLPVRCGIAAEFRRWSPGEEVTLWPSRSQGGRSGDPKEKCGSQGY